MNANNEPLVLAKGASTLARARFGPGMLLQHDDLEQMNTYTRELSRLLFSSLFGCGVVCGLVVSAKQDCGKVTVTVQAGIALNCRGDPIHVPQPQRLVLDKDCDPNLKDPVWVVLCGTSKCCAPRTAMCGSDEDDSPSVCTRERDWFEIRIVRTRPPCTCGCAEPGANDGPSQLDSECNCANPKHACHVKHYAGTCGCECGDCASCDCDCVLLARLDRTDVGENPEWKPDHRVRRFVRPVLMRDPRVWIEEAEAREKEEDKEKEKDKGKDKDKEEEHRSVAAEAIRQPEGVEFDPKQFGLKQGPREAEPKSQARPPKPKT